MADAPGGYERGPDATVRASEAGWKRIDDARSVILVEGVSDQIAVDAAAEVAGRDLSADGVVVMPIGGAHAIHRTLRRVRDRRPEITVAGLCDSAEAPEFRRAADETAPSPFRFFVCVDDLEDELMRAAGPDLVLHVLDQQGDARSFATLRAQPQWRGRPFDAQFRRFTGAGSGRKHRYGGALVRALGRDRLPAPLVDVLAVASRAVIPTPRGAPRDHGT